MGSSRDKDDRGIMHDRSSSGSRPTNTPSSRPGEPRDAPRLEIADHERGLKTFPVAAILDRPAELRVEGSGTCGVEMKPRSAALSRLILDGSNQHGADAVSAMLGNNE